MHISSGHHRSRRSWPSTWARSSTSSAGEIIYLVRGLNGVQRATIEALVRHAVALIVPTPGKH